VNLEGLYQVNGFISWDFPIRAIRSSLNLKSDLAYDHNASLVNGARNNGNTWTLGQGADLNFSYKEKLDLSGALRWNTTMPVFPAAGAKINTTGRRHTHWIVTGICPGGSALPVM